MRGRFRFGLSVVILTAALAAATAGWTASGERHASLQLLRVSSTAAVTTWDPIASFSTEVFYMANVYEPLIWATQTRKGKTTFTPGLASTWSHNGDSTRWTFHLRKGVTFHNGDPVTSADVKASIEAAADHGGASFIWSALKSVVTPDASTVIINASAPARIDLVASSEYDAWIVCKSALEAAAKDSKYWASGRECGTGPYMLKSYTAGTQVVLAGYQKYWRGLKGHFQNVVVQITPEAITQQQMLTSGQIDLAFYPPSENLKKLVASGKFTKTVAPTSETYVAFFNTTRAPLDNKTVRQALSWAMPYANIVKVGAYGLGTQSRGPVPKGIFPWSKTTPQYHQNLAKARKLLARAGHQGGKFTLNLTYAAENQAEARFAPLIKDAFKKVGVKVNLKAILFNQQWAQAKADPTKAQDIFLLLYWPTYSDAGADNLWSLFHSSKKPFFNLSYWKSETYDKLVDDGAAITGSNEAAAQSKYNQAMRMLYNEAPGAYLFDARVALLVPKGLTARGVMNINYPFVAFFYNVKKKG